MKYDIRYVGAKGTVEMSSAPIIYQEQDFFKRKYGYSATSLLNGRGSKVTRFHKEAQEYTLNLKVLTGIRDAADEIMKGIEDIFENDVAQMSPGRIYVNGEYINCYVIASESEDRTFVGKYFGLRLTILAEQPIWIREELQTFDMFEASATTGFKLPTAIPFCFTSSAGSRQLQIDHYTSVFAEISLFGPATSPSFSIGSHIYQVFGTLSAGERYVINQINKTVEKITNSGEVINSFNLRNKEYSAFDPIPAGESIMTYSGEFPISITLFYERGEPKWK